MISQQMVVMVKRYHGILTSPTSAALPVAIVILSTDAVVGAFSVVAASGRIASDLPLHTLVHICGQAGIELVRGRGGGER